MPCPTSKWITKKVDLLIFAMFVIGLDAAP